MYSAAAAASWALPSRMMRDALSEPPSSCSGHHADAGSAETRRTPAFLDCRASSSSVRCPRWSAPATAGTPTGPGRFR